MAFSFGTQGSTPMATSSLTGLPVPGSITGGTPQSKALNGVQPGSMQSNANLVTSALGPNIAPKNTATPYNASIAPVTTGLIPKSQTINNVDGSSHTVTYQPPASQPDSAQPITPAPLGSAGNPQVQGSNPTSNNAGFGGAGIAVPPGGSSNGSTGNSGATGGLLAPQAGSSVGTNPTPASIGGLLGNLSLNGSPEVATNTQALQDYQTQVANALGTVGSTAGPLGNQLGLESNINSAAALKEQALETGITNALQEQNLQQTGLNEAGGLVNPSNQFTQVSPGNIAYNAQGQAVASTPTNQPIGQTVQVSPTPNLSGGTAGESSSYTIKSGDTLDAIAAANGISESVLQAANPNVVATNLQPGQSLTIPSSASTSGTPFQAGVVQGNEALGATYAGNVSADTQAKTVQNQITSYLAANPNLNPSIFSNANAALQALNGQVSNPAYQTLANYLQEYVNTLAPILGVGGDPTNLKTQIAQGFINAQASGQSIATVLANIQSLADAKVASQAGGTAGTVQPGPSTTTTGPSSSSGGWSSLGD